MSEQQDDPGRLLCLCGHERDEHHDMIAECEFFGSNEEGGADERDWPHCGTFVWERSAAEERERWHMQEDRAFYHAALLRLEDAYMGLRESVPAHVQAELDAIIAEIQRRERERSDERRRLAERSRGGESVAVSRREDREPALPAVRPFRFTLTLSAPELIEVQRSRLRRQVAGVVGVDEGEVVRVRLAREHVALKPAILEAVGEVAQVTGLYVIDLEIDAEASDAPAWAKAREVTDSMRERGSRCALCGQGLFLMCIVEHEDGKGGHYLHPPGECIEALGLAIADLRRRLDDIRAQAL